jgi:hypothetical protein
VPAGTGGLYKIAHTLDPWAGADFAFHLFYGPRYSPNAKTQLAGDKDFGFG